MNEIIYPRSPRETMDGWMHLPRYLDKVRLHLAGKLHPDYQPNLGKGFDEKWLRAAGLTHEESRSRFGPLANCAVFRFVIWESGLELLEVD